MRVFLLSLFISLLLLTLTFGNEPQNSFEEIEVPQLEEKAEEVQQQEKAEEVQQQENTEEVQQQVEAEEEAMEVNYSISLKELGFYKDDYLDEELNLRNAILRFQSQHNLVVNGELDEETQLVFNQYVTHENNGVIDNIEEAPTDKKWIVINKTKRILTLYEGTNILKKYPIAQGKLPRYTPEGKFSIVNKLIDPAWGGAGIYKPVRGGAPNNPLGPRWMGLSINGGGRYGIHGNNNPQSIGTDASLGCIRMMNTDVKELFELIPKNTIVWIGTDEVLRGWGILQESYLDSIEI